MAHITETDPPAVHRLVIGVWEETAMKCWRNEKNQWIDYWHNSYCYTAPDFWYEDPFESKLKKQQ